MSNEYHILLLEDDESDADLIEIELNKLDMTIHLDVIQSEQKLKDELTSNPPDLIISDFNLPTLTGTDALKIVREQHPDLPFILVSGYIGEEKAVDAMLEGASDYAMKENLERLGPAILREIQNYEEQKKKQSELQKTRNRYESLIQSVNGIVWEASADTFEFNYVSPQVQELLGYTPDQWLDKPHFWQDHIHADDRKKTIEFCHHKTKKGHDHSLEYRMIDADGEVVWLRDYVTVISMDGQTDRLRGLMVDISKEKKTKRQRDKAYNIAGIGHWELDPVNKELYWSDMVKRLHELGPDYEPNLDEALNFYKEGKHRQKITDVVERAIEMGIPFDVELKIVTAQGNERWIRTVGEAEFHSGECVRLYGSTQNISHRKETERKLRDVVEYSTNMFYRHDTDHVLSYVSPQSKEFLGYSPEEAKKRWTDFVTDHPVNDQGFKHTQRAIETGEAQPDFPLQLKKANGQKIWVRVNEAPITENGETVAIAGSLTDISEQKKYQELLRQTNRLARVGSWELDLSNDGDQQLYWSEMMYEILEVDSDFQPTLEEALDFYTSQSRPKVEEAVEQATNKGVPFDLELLVKTGSGNKRWVRSIGHAEFEDGECLRLYGSYQDIHERKTSELELEQRNNFIEAIIDNVPIGIAVTRIDDGKSILMNQNFSEIYGWSKDSLTDVDSFFESIYPDEERRRSIRQMIDSDIASGDPERMQWENLTITTQEGEKRIVDAKNIPLVDQNRMISAVIDVTDKVEAQRRKTETLQRIGDAFFAVDEDWSITYWNNTAEEVLGMPREEILGENLWNVYDDAVELDFYNQYHKALDEQKAVQFQEYYPPIGKWFEVNAYPSKTGLSVYFRNITERKKSRERLKELNNELEKRAAELEATNEELEQFAYVASHDLQEPLRMVSSFLKRLEKKYDDQLDDKAQQYINFAVDGAQRMRRIILDLLNYSRMNQDDFEKETLAVDTMLEEIKQLEQSRIEETGAQINYGNLPKIIAAKTPLQQVFQNLINNAIKYRTPGTPPTITITGIENGDHWQFSVKDDGIGIKEEFQDNIFTIFKRLHTQDEYTGTGIGLSVSKKIVEKHGGQIWVDSAEGEGSTFYFTIEKES